MDDKVSSKLVLSRYIDDYVNSDPGTGNYPNMHTGYNTYVSLLNTSATPVTVTATYRDSSGNVLGTPATISIGGLSTVYFRPTQYNASTEGSIEFVSTLPSLVGTFQQIRAEEPFTDANSNHQWDSGESFVDVYGIVNPSSPGGTYTTGSYMPRQSALDNLIPY